MAMVPVSRATETPSDCVFPWVVRCFQCGAAVAEISQEELTAMVHLDKIDPILCFDCEEKNLMHGGEIPVLHTYNERAPWPVVSLPTSLLGLV